MKNNFIIIVKNKKIISPNEKIPFSLAKMRKSFIFSISISIFANEFRFESGKKYQIKFGPKEEIKIFVKLKIQDIKKEKNGKISKN